MKAAPTPGDRLCWKLEAGAKRLAALLAGGAALALVAATVLLAFSSLGRYAADTALALTDEMVGFLLVAIAFLGVSESYLRGKQVRLLFIRNLLPARLRAAFALLGDALALLVLTIVLRETYAFAAFSLEIGAQSPVADLAEGPWMLVIPLSVGALMLAIALKLAMGLRSLVLGKPLAAEGIDDPAGQEDR
ncbi:MAG: TRAP transporter small permease [Pseudomonadota bacterium]